MSYFKINTSATAERLARQLETCVGFRVLRCVPKPDRIWLRSMPPCAPADRLTIGVLDTETTSLDPHANELIEIAIGKLVIDRTHGDLVDMVPPRWWLEQPSQPISEEIQVLTGLSDAILAGEVFDEDAILAELASVDVIVAANARFDAAFLVERFPLLIGMRLPWACTVREIDWSSYGMHGGRSVEALLTAAGLFALHRHRAGPDVWSLMNLLMRADPDGRTVAADLVDRARRPSARIEAWGAPFAAKDQLKAAGFSWDAVRRVWTREGEPEAIANEAAWLRSVHPLIKPIVVPVDWCTRHLPPACR